MLTRAGITLCEGDDDGTLVAVKHVHLPDKFNEEQCGSILQVTYCEQRLRSQPVKYIFRFWRGVLKDVVLYIHSPVHFTCASAASLFITTFPFRSCTCCTETIQRAATRA